MEYGIPKFHNKNSWGLNKKIKKFDKDIAKSERDRL